MEELTLADAAREYGIPYPTLTKAHRDRKLGVTKRDGKLYTTREAMERYINKKKTPRPNNPNPTQEAEGPADNTCPEFVGNPKRRAVLKFDR